MSGMSPLFHGFSKEQTRLCKLLHIYPAHPSPLRLAALWWTVRDSLECRADIGWPWKAWWESGSSSFITENENFAHRDVCRKAFCCCGNTSSFFLQAHERPRKRETPSCKRERKRERETPRHRYFFLYLIDLLSYCLWIKNIKWKKKKT